MEASIAKRVTVGASKTCITFTPDRRPWRVHRCGRNNREYASRFEHRVEGTNSLLPWHRSQTLSVRCLQNWPIAWIGSSDIF